MTVTCPLCGLASEVLAIDFRRAHRFTCETGHDFVLRTEATVLLSEATQDLLTSLKAAAALRSDGQILLLRKQDGRLHAELVDRSKLKLK